MRVSEAKVLGLVLSLPVLGLACASPEVVGPGPSGEKTSQGSSQGGAGGGGGGGGSGGFTGGGVTVILPDANISGAGATGAGTAIVEVWPPGPDYTNVTNVTYGAYALGPLVSSLDAQTVPGGSTEHCAGLFAVVRDFKLGSSAAGHPDFEKPPMQVDRGIVTDTLGDDGKPIYASADGKTRTTSGQANFDQWYRDSEGVNMSYVLGLRFVSTGGNVITFAASIGHAVDSGTTNSSYFPLDGAGFGNERKQHNYGFTTEIHTSFLYNGGEIFTFQGDDDVFVYINNKLVIDLGGIHEQETGTVEIDAQAEALGLEVGKVYDLAVFNAERHTSQSNFRIDTTMTFTNCGVIIP